MVHEELLIEESPVLFGSNPLPRFTENNRLLLIIDMIGQVGATRILLIGGRREFIVLLQSQTPMLKGILDVLFEYFHLSGITNFIRRVHNRCGQGIGFRRLSMLFRGQTKIISTEKSRFV